MSRVVISSIPFNTRLVCSGQHAHGSKNILARDRARAQKFLAGLHPHGPAAFHEAKKRRAHHHHHHSGGQTDTGGTGTGGTGTGGTGTGTAPASSGSSVDVTDAAVTYVMDVGVGTPPTNYSLLIDTGSSNTWIGAQTKYTPTSSSTDTRQTVKVSYGSGSFSGTEYTDVVTLNDSLVIPKQSIGVSSSAQGFDDVDGILGIGPVDLTEGTVGGGSTPVPTVTDNLFSNGTIPVESIGISYVPTTSATAVANGELTFGGVDESKITGEVSYVPITSSSPASNYWGIDQELTYNGVTILSQTSGIVDTGTTLLLLATNAFQAYQKATGAKLDSQTGLLTVTEAQYDNMQSLIFNIGGTSFELTKNAQIWPRTLNSTLGGQEGQIYLITADLGSDIGQGLDFIDGFGFLQRFYSVYDTTNSQVGLATTPFTTAETN
ncbi:acid protease [Mycena floridula]|nr:acid protease [Mycena floridula]